MLTDNRHCYWNKDLRFGHVYIFLIWRHFSNSFFMPYYRFLANICLLIKFIKFTSTYLPKAVYFRFTVTRQKLSSRFTPTIESILRTKSFSLAIQLVYYSLRCKVWRLTKIATETEYADNSDNYKVVAQICLKESDILEL